MGVLADSSEALISGSGVGVTHLLRGSNHKKRIKPWICAFCKLLCLLRNVRV